MVKDLRMPKGWMLFATNRSEFGEEVKTREERMRRDHKAQVMIKNVKSEKLEKLEENAEKDFIAAEDRKRNLLAAYDEKKLKSKALIKQARNIKSRKAAAAMKKVAERVEATDTEEVVVTV
jgi:hypothetical protein